MSDKVNWDDFTPADKSVPKAKAAQVDWSQFTPEEKGSGALRRVADQGIKLAQGVVGVPETAVGLADLVTGGAAGKAVEDAGVRFKDAKAIMGEYLSPEQKAADAEVNQTKGFLPTIGAMARNPSTILGATMESAPSMLAGGAVSRGLLAAAPKIGGIVAGAAGEGIVTAGQNTEQVRQETPGGLLPDGAALPLAASGALTGAISLGAGKLANKLGIGDMQTMLATGKLGPVGDKAIEAGAKKGLARKVAEGFANEGVLQELPQSYQEQVAQNIAQGKPWDEGAAEAGAQGLMAGGLMGAGANVASHFGENPPIPDTTPAPGQEPVPAVDAGQPQLGYNPMAGTHTVFPDGSVVLNSESSNGAATVRDMQRANRLADAANPFFGDPATPVRPSEAMGLSPTAENSLTNAAIVAVDTGAHQAQIPTSPLDAPLSALGHELYRTNQRLRQEADALGLDTDGLHGDAARMTDGKSHEDYLMAANDQIRKAMKAAKEIPHEESKADSALAQDGAGTKSPVAQASKAPAANSSGPVATGAVRPSPDRVGELGKSASGTAAGVAPAAVAPAAKVPDVKATPISPAAPAPGLPAAGTPAVQAAGVNQAPATQPKGATTNAASIENPGEKTSPTPSAQGAPQASGDKPSPVGPVAPESPEKQKALDRIAAGKAWFGNAAKAQVFIAQNGLKDTHKAVKSSDGKRWDVTSVSAPTIDAAAHQAATSPNNDLAQPTDGQKKAGNYQKGHVNLNGLDLAIENPAGSTRSGTDKNGKAWTNTLQHHYGYIKGTVGNDKDHVDLFVKPETPLDYSGTVFVIDQNHPHNGRFDEHKVMVGFDNEVQAKAAYNANYAKGWKGMKSVMPMTFDAFKTWVKDGAKNTPVSKDPAAITQPQGATSEPKAKEAVTPKSGSEAPAAAAAVTPAQSKFTSDGVGRSPAEKELQAQSHTVEKPGDVLMSDGSFVAFDAVVAMARDGIESGQITPAPAQMHFKLDMSMRDATRVLDAATASDPVAAAAPEAPTAKPDAMTEREKAAKAKMFGALGKLAALASKNTRMNWTPEEEQQLLPIVIELFDGAMELGAVTFQKAVRYVREFIGSNLDKETADAIPFETLQGAYIHTARKFKDQGATTGKEVMGFDSLADLEKSVESADTETKDTQNAAPKLDRPSAGTLAGAPAESVSGTEAVGPVAAGTDGSSGPDGSGNQNADRPGGQLHGGVAGGSGGIPVPATGGRGKRGSAKKPGVSGNAGLQPGLEFIDTSGGTGGLIPVNPAPNAAPIASPAFNLQDFTIEDDLGLGEGGPKAKYKGNVEAIRLLSQLDAESRMATPTEQRVLAKYVGWGALAPAFDEANKDWSREYAELKGLLSEDDYADARMSTRYAHFTSKEIIVDGIYAALRHFGFTGGRTLEGGFGTGNFAGLMPADMRSAGRITGVEREPFSAKIAKHLYPRQNVQEADFTEFVGNDDYFDLATGNPPFASDAQVDRSGRKHLSGLSLHNYFFAKAVDMLREGGLLAEVVTNSFLDAKTDTARQYISDRTKFLGAIRLPNNAFSKNAGTEVTTDLIFLQKRPESEWGSKAAKADAKAWLATGEYKDIGGRTVALNQYFIDHPDMMLGNFGAFGTMYREGSTALVAKPGQDTGKLLKEAISKLPPNVYVDRAITMTQTVESAFIKALAKPSVQEGGFFEEDGKLLQRIRDLAGEARGQEVTPETKWTEKTKLGEAGFARIKALAAMRATVRGLLSAELANDPAMTELRAKLNEQYDAYAKEHGLINDAGTLRVFDDDPDFPLLASLEHGYTPPIGLAAAKSMGIKPVPSSAKKGPIFTQRVVDARQTVRKVETPADALAVSMAERGKLDSKYIGELLGRDPEEVLHELSDGATPLLFSDPATGEYVLRDAYLSGNVRAKLVQAKQAGMFNNIRALEDVQPEDVGSHDIVARVGSPWVPERVYEDFAKSLLGEGTDASVKYVKATAGFSAYIRPGSETANTNTWGIPAYPASDILSALLNNKPIKVTYKDSDGKTYTDATATENANAKAQDMRNRFQDWLFADGERAELLGRAYNDTNNNYVTRQYDGEWMTFPGKVPDAIVKFRRHQRNAIARIVQDRTALLDHVVGSGKTFTIVSAAMELRRTGLAKKPMIAVPNHLVKQWASDFYQLYPGANILTATKKDFEKSNRRRFLAKIATGDWDAVIIAHSSFGFIKPAPDFEAKFNTKQVAAIVATIKEVENGDGDKQQKKRTVKQLEGLKERLENRIKSLRDKPMDSLLDFGEIGVDQLFVDEAHMFKNLMFSTKMQNIAGLGDAKGSQRAYDMYVKANQIFDSNGRGQGLVFATGTPVSNSLAEMYHMMRYLMPNQMDEMGFQSFDAWANTYASVEQVWMQKASGDGFKAQNRMSNFVNTPELLKVFDQVSDTVTMDDIKAAYREENGGKEFPLPKLKGGKRAPVSLRKSAAQDAYMATIASRALAVEQRKGPPLKGQDNILVIMSDARKAAMDIRLVDPTVTQREPGGRIDRASQEIFARYKQYDKEKGTQIVFSDLGTPLKTVKKEMAEYQALKDRIDAGETPEVTQRAALGDEAAQAKVDDAEDAHAELDAKGGDWLGAMQAAERGFSVYDDLKAALMEKGIPENEIAFIHDYNTDDQKAGLFRKMNAGQIRVLVGSTPKLGAGTNVQKKLVALHHLDVPWKPSDVEQREGRIIRQGNELDLANPDKFEVEILAYVTQDTLDMRMWQVQETKLKMINQLRTRKIGREIDNAFEDLELSAGEMQAAATGNIDLLREIQIKAEIKKVEQRKRAFDAQKSDLENRKKSVAKKLESLPAKIQNSKVMAEATDAYNAELAEKAKEFRATIDGKVYTDSKEASAVLLSHIDNRVYMQRQEDGLFGGRKIPQAEFEVAPIEDKDNPWALRPVPLSVNFNGEQFKSRDKLAEAFSNSKGDAHAILWKVEGSALNRRTLIENAIRERVAEAVSEQSSQPIGALGPFNVSVEGQEDKRGKSLEVTLTYAGQTIGNSIGVSDREIGQGADVVTTMVPAIVRMAENMAAGSRQQNNYENRQLAQALKDKAELDAAPAQGEWPEHGKLDQLREQYKRVLRDLAGAGIQATLDGEVLEGNMGVQPAPTSDDADVVFSRPEASRQASNTHLVTLQQHIDAITDNWTNAPEVIVARNMRDAVIPQDVRDYDATLKSQGATGEPRGFFYKGKAYLLSEQLASEHDATTVLFHEVLGHYGLRRVFGKELKPILQQIATMRRADVVAKATEYGLDMADESQRLQAAEEVLAEMAQKTPEIGFVKRAVAAIRTWLRANVLGFSALKLTDAEIIRSYILPARGWVERGIDAAKKDAVPAFSRDTKQSVMNPNDVVGNQGDPAGDSTTGPLPTSLFETVGMPERGRAIINNSAEALSARLRDSGFDVDLQHSGSIVGPSSYLRIYDPQTGRTYPLSVRLSGHSKGAFNSQEVWNVSKQAEFDRVVQEAMRMRKLGPTAGLSAMEERERKAVKIRLASAYKKLAKGKPLTLSEQEAVDARGNQGGRSADDSTERPLTEAKFYSGYRQHIDLRGTPEVVASVMRDGWKAGIGPNVTTPYRGGEPTDVISRRFMPKAGQTVFLVPKAWVKETPNGGKIIEGWKPKAHEVVTVESDGQSMYEAYTKAFSNESPAPTSDGATMFNRATTARDLTQKASGPIVTNLKDYAHKTGNRLADFRNLALGSMGRRQLVDVYGDILPLDRYNTLVQQMDADKNEAGAEADTLADTWGKLNKTTQRPAEDRHVAEMMHDSTLAQIDPDKPYQQGDNEDVYRDLALRFNGLSSEGKSIYRQARDMYAAHFDKVKTAIRERIMRSEMTDGKKAALLEKMDAQFFSSVKGVYFPLQRFGQYTVLVRNAEGDIQSVNRAETLNEAEETRRILLKAFPAAGGFTVGKVLKAKEFNSSNESAGRGFMKELFDVLEKQGVSEDVQDSINQLYLASLPDLSWAKHGIHRKGTPGFSQDARRAFAQNMFHGARYLAKIRYSDQLQTELEGMQEHVDKWINVLPDEDGTNPSVKAQQVVDEFVKRHELLMNPDSNPISTALTSLGFVFHLGLSPASALVNLTQTAMVAYPIMGAKWGFDKSASALMMASKQAATNRNDISKILTGDERRAYDEAVRAGVIDVTQSHDLAGISQGEDAKVTWKLRPVMKAASFLFHHAEKFNRQVTFVAAYRLAKSAGSGHEVAYEQAVNATYGGHFDYAASNRPRFMQGNVARVVLLFKQYAQNMIFTLGREAQLSITGTPAEKKQARRALAGLLTTHALAAGAFGLPMMGTLLALASMLGGDDDEPWDAKTALQNMLADALGQKPAEVIAHGISRLTPWDISGRVGLDKLLLPDIQEGLEGQRAVEAWMTSALGAVAGIAINAGNGMQEISDGRWARGLEAMMPTALRGPLKAYRYATEGNIDKTGIPINDQVGTAGVAGQALGFSPSETRNAQEGRSAIYQADRAIMARRTHLMHQYGTAAMNADEDGKAEAREDIRKFNAANPKVRINPMQMAQSVRNRMKRVQQAEEGVYLPKNRRDAVEAGRFAVVD